MCSKYLPINYIKKCLRFDFDKLDVKFSWIVFDTKRLEALTTNGTHTHYFRHFPTNRFIRRSFDLSMGFLLQIIIIAWAISLRRNLHVRSSITILILGDIWMEKGPVYIWVCNVPNGCESSDCWRPETERKQNKIAEIQQISLFLLRSAAPPLRTPHTSWLPHTKYKSHYNNRIQSGGLLDLIIVFEQKWWSQTKLSSEQWLLFAVAATVSNIYLRFTSLRFIFNS